VAVRNVVYQEGQLQISGRYFESVMKLLVEDTRGFEGRVGSLVICLANGGMLYSLCDFVYAFLAEGMGCYAVSILVHYSNCICMYVMYV